MILKVDSGVFSIRSQRAYGKRLNALIDKISQAKVTCVTIVTDAIGAFGNLEVPHGYPGKLLEGGASLSAAIYEMAVSRHAQTSRQLRR